MSLLPAGVVSGCTVTWAQAGPADRTASTSTAAAPRTAIRLQRLRCVTAARSPSGGSDGLGRRMADRARLSVHGEGDRHHLLADGVGPDGDREGPGPRDGDVHIGGVVVAGAPDGKRDVQGTEVLGGQAQGGVELGDRLRCPDAAQHVDVHLVAGADPGRVDDGVHLDPERGEGRREREGGRLLGGHGVDQQGGDGEHGEGDADLGQDGPPQPAGPDRTGRRPADLPGGTPDPEAHAPTAVHDAPAEGTHADQADHQEDLHYQGPPVGGVDEGVEAAHLADRLDRPGRHDDDDRGEGAGRHRAGDGGRVLGTVRLVRPPEEEGGEEGEAAQPDGGRGQVGNVEGEPERRLVPRRGMAGQAGGAEQPQSEDGAGRDHPRPPPRPPAEAALDPEQHRDERHQQHEPQELDPAEARVHDGVGQRWPDDVGEGQRRCVDPLDGDAEHRRHRQHPPRRPQDPSDPAGGAARRVGRVLWASWWVLAVATVLGIAIQGVYAAALPLTDIVRPSLADAVVHTRFGRIELLRLVLLVAFVPVLLGIQGRLGRGPRRWAWVIPAGAVLGLGLLSTPGLAGHASTGDQPALGLALDVTHLAAAAVWLGGLALLATFLLGRPDEADRPEDAAAVTRTVSACAFAAVVVVVATGTVQSIRQVGSLYALVHTTYGRTLVVKILLVIGLIGVGALSRRIVHGGWGVRLRVRRPARKVGGAAPGPVRSGRLRRSVLAEIGIALAVHDAPAE